MPTAPPRVCARCGRPARKANRASAAQHSKGAQIRRVPDDGASCERPNCGTTRSASTTVVVDPPSRSITSSHSAKAATVGTGPTLRACAASITSPRASSMRSTAERDHDDRSGVVALESLNPPVRDSAAVVALTFPWVSSKMVDYGQAWARRPSGCGPANQWAVTNNPVFMTELGRPVDPRNMLPVVEAAAKTANVEGVAVHTLRYPGAVGWLSAGVRIKAVADLLGHSSTCTGTPATTPHVRLWTAGAVRSGCERQNHSPAYSC